MNEPRHRGPSPFDSGSLTLMLTTMVCVRQREGEASGICAGSARSAKGRKVYSKLCGNHFKVWVRVAYVADHRGPAKGSAEV